MSDGGELEIYKQHRQAQDKYIYFLLAAAGASIAFALNQTKGLALAETQIPLGVAVLLWGLSFAAGCARLSQIDVMLSMNQDLIRIQTGQHEWLSHAGEIPIAADVVRTKLARGNQWAAFWASWQYRCLIGGAVGYIGWHVFEMYLRSL